MQFSDDKFIRYIVNQYSGMITGIAFQHTKSISDAEDIMQDVFLTLIKKQPPFETKEHFRDKQGNRISQNTVINDSRSKYIFGIIVD